MQRPQQAQFFPDPSLPPGQGDLEALERLKDAIKNNQHEVFRATPRPAALASLYKGPLPFRVPPHPEQILESREKATATPDAIFEKMTSSSFIDDIHNTHGTPTVPGHPGVPSRPVISSSTVRTSLLPWHLPSLIVVYYAGVFLSGGLSGPGSPLKQQIHDVSITS
jgi:hypothetical protein